MRKLSAILLVFVFSPIFTGCVEDKANAKKEVVLSVSEENLPFAPGDIVLLKPDGHKAVIQEIFGQARGLHKVTYDSTGQGFVEKEFIKITSLRYRVRYKVTQEQPRSYVLKEDGPTELLHYKERIIHWYEIQEKKS